MTHDEFMRSVALGLDEVLNPGLDGDKRKIGFALLTYEFGAKPEHGRVNYIGNGNRSDIRAALKELLARWDGQAIPASNVQQ